MTAAFRNRVSMSQHNPMMVRDESRGHTEWLPGRNVFVQDILGSTTDLLGYAQQALAHYTLDGSIPRSAGVNAKSVNIRIDSVVRRTMFMNTSNAPCYMDVYRLYPKQSVIDAADLPVPLIEVQQQNAEELVDESIVDPQYPYPSSDYRFTPFQSAYLKSIYRIKKIKTVRLMGGARTTVTSSVGGFKINQIKEDASVANGTILKKGQSVVMLYKFRGELGLYKPPGLEGEKSYIRTMEGGVANLSNITAKFHVENDVRKVVRNVYLTDDNAGTSTFIADPLVGHETAQVF